MIDETTKELVRDLRARAGFDACCAALGRAVFRRLGSAPGHPPMLERAHVLRISVHVRSDDAYLNFAVAAADAQEGEGALAPSASLWRLMQRHRQPLLFDVLLNEAIVYDGERAPTTVHEQGAELTEHSRVRFSSRDATHVLALPLRSAEPFGMVCLEARETTLVGERMRLHDVLDDLVTLVDIAAPHLAACPPTEMPPGTDFPVIGARTRALYAYLQIFAKQREIVLITGASGTGKSRLARWVHDRSEVSAGPFETFTLHGLNEDMQLAHLFGWRRGAFTGASESRAGLIETAAGGTLLIDEIDKLSLKAQAGLMNVLESGTYRRLGETTLRPMAARIIVATNVDLRAAIAEGSFREDLYYRINVLPVALPRLDERHDEIAGWARLMVSRCNAERGHEGAFTIEPDAIVALEASSWPGNLRQLDNVLRRAYAFALSTGGHAAGGRTAGQHVRVTRDHVHAALLLDGARFEPDTKFIDNLIDSARAFLHLQLAESDEARAALGAEVLRDNLLFAMTWAVALEELGTDHARIAKLIGKENSLRSRNYHKELRREMRKLEALHEAYGRPLPAHVQRNLG